MNQGAIAVRLPSWVGDGALAAPAVAALQKARPGQRMILVGTAQSAPLYGRWPATALLLIERKSSRDLFRLARALREASVEAALVLSPSFRSALPFFLAGVRHRVGFSTDGRAILLNDAFPPAGRDVHLARQFLRLAERLGADARAPLAPHLPVGADEKEAAASCLEGMALEARRTVALCPGATYGETKRWPLAHWIRLGRALTARGWSVVLLGGPEERERTEPLVAQIGTGVQSLAGRLALRQSLALLHLLAGAVSNDSGLLHLAAAAGCPVLGLFGSTNPAWTGPLGEDSATRTLGLDCSPCYARRCPTQIECLRDLAPESVVESFERLLTTCERVAP